MKKPESTPKNVIPQARPALALRWIGIAAPVAGFVDLIISMIRMPLPDEYDVASSIFAPLAATTLFAAGLFLLVWALSVVISRLRSSTEVPLLICLTVAILCLEVLLLLLGVLVPSELTADSATTLLKLGAGCFIALVLVRGSFLLGQDISRGFYTRRSPALVVLATPFLGASTLFLLWFTRLRLDAPLLSQQALKIVGLIGLAIVAVMIFFYFVGHRGIGRNAALLPLFAILIGPLVSGTGATKHSDPTDIPRGVETKNANVFLITIDSLRADTLSCYGATRVQTKSIDYIAEHGVVFNTAISASSWTLPAVSSFMTGVSPAVHGATAWQKRLPDDFKTLAEYFKEAGYHTMALGQNPVLDKARNLDQGFDTYDWISTENRHPGVSIGRRLLQLFHAHTVESTTEAITRMAIDRLDQIKQGPAFFWIHYYDPHMPYTPPAPFVDETTAKSPFGLAFDDIERVRMGRFATTQAERDWVKSLYEGEVRFVDDAIGRLVTSIKDMGLYEDAVIVVASDHGEEFWEHGGFEHGHSMHQEVLRVPLIIKQPGSVRPGRVDAAVGMEGLAPTILDLVDIAYDKASMTTPSFASYLDLDTPPTKSLPISSFGTLYFEKLEAVTGPQFKYIHSVEYDHQVLYDRMLDPLELHPIEVSENPEAAARARGFLDHARSKGNSMRAADQKDVVLDAGTEESLRSLGYID